MLYPYPRPEEPLNWLHRRLLTMLQIAHDGVQRDILLPDWKKLLAEDENRLVSRNGLRDRIKDYADGLRRLSKEELERVRRAINEQNRFEELLRGASDCDRLQDLPESIHSTIKNLFDYAFDLIKELEIRDAHYEHIYENLQACVCPFCGMEDFEAPRSYRDDASLAAEDLDHYLPKSIYPFAAANLINLLPMGMKCNERYKGAEDLLRKEGKRRISHSPYDPPAIIISLLNSSLFARPDPRYGHSATLPEWKIRFSPDTEETETWCEIFHIRQRYETTVLDANYRTWIEDFQKAGKRYHFEQTLEGLKIALTEHISLQEELGIRDKAFLKAALFRLLLQNVESGNQRLINLLLGNLEEESAIPLRAN